MVSFLDVGFGGAVVVGSGSVIVEYLERAESWGVCLYFQERTWLGLEKFMFWWTLVERLQFR